MSRISIHLLVTEQTQWGKAVTFRCKWQLPRFLCRREILYLTNLQTSWDRWLTLPKGFILPFLTFSFAVLAVMLWSTGEYLGPFTSVISVTSLTRVHVPTGCHTNPGIMPQMRVSAWQWPNFLTGGILNLSLCIYKLDYLSHRKFIFAFCLCYIGLLLLFGYWVVWVDSHFWVPTSDGM